jgi:hypothetical protein
MGPIVRSVIEAQRFAELAKRPAYADLWYATLTSGRLYRAVRANVEIERRGVGASVTPPLSLMSETPSC